MSARTCDSAKQPFPTWPPTTVTWARRRWLLRGTGSLSGDATLDTDGRVGHGTARLLGRNASAKVAGLDMGGDIDVKATLRRGDFNQRHFDLSGTTVELRNMQVAGAERASAWKGRVAFKRGRIDAQSPFQVDATTDLDLSDALVLLALFAERTDYPRWTLSLLDSGQVQAGRRCAGARAI